MKFKLCTKLFPLFVSVLVLQAVARAQNLRSDLTKLQINLNREFDQELKGWTHESLTAEHSNGDVLIEFWVRGDRRVKGSILSSPTDEAAGKAIEEFVSSESRKVEGIGEAAYAWGYGDSVAFHRGHFQVFVSTEPVGLLMLSVEKSQQEKFKRAEQAATNNWVAKFIDSVILGRATRRRL